MAIRVGNKAEGEDFFDRVTELEDIWGYLEGNHIVLSGPRRLGKTSLLQKIVDESMEHGLFARLIDLEGADSAESFVACLDDAFRDDSISKWHKNAGDPVKQWLDRIRKIEIKIPGGAGGGFEMQSLPATNWAQKGRCLKQRLSKTPALILFDEFTVFLEKLFKKDRDEAEGLLGWLRAWRQESGLICRFVYSGSVGFNTLLERYESSTLFSDCYDFQLKPFKQSAALAMLREEARREEWHADDSVLQHLCARVGWLSPFYLNLLLAETLSAARDRELESRKSGNLQISDVDDGYDRLLATRSRFIHWYQRLRRDLDASGLPFALAILAALAKPDNGLSRRQLLNRLARREADPEQRSARLAKVILKLEEDGYLAQESDRYYFQSFLLRDYWRRNHA